MIIRRGEELFVILIRTLNHVSLLLDEHSVRDQQVADILVLGDQTIIFKLLHFLFHLLGDHQGAAVRIFMAFGPSILDVFFEEISVDKSDVLR